MFKAIANFFRKLAGARPTAAVVLDQIQETAMVAVPIVKHVADLTPTRADNEILQLVTVLGLPLAGLAADWLRQPIAVEWVLKESAKKLLRDEIGEKASDAVVNAAVDLAYALSRTKDAS